MFYKSFFYECLVNLYFKKKDFLEAFQGQIYLFSNRYIYLVKKTTLFDSLSIERKLTDAQMECMQFGICDYAPRQVEDVPFFHY